jgi:serine/threonine protein kinase
MSDKGFSAVFGDIVLEVPRSFDKYDIVREIGLGGFSVVYLVRNRHTFEELACKVVCRQFLTESGTFHRFEQEARLLEQLQHPNIIQLVEIVYAPQYIYLIMEYCSCGDLCEYIDMHGCLDNHTARFVLSHLVSALGYLHDRGIVHRDLKPENVFIDSHHNPKLADLGLCHTVTENQLLKTPCGTAFYAAPELISGLAYDGKQTDVWSLGIVLYVMLTGCMPWANTNFPELQEEIVRGAIPVPPYLGRDCEDLIRSMLSVDPSKRPTMNELAKHPWISDFAPRPSKLRKIGTFASIGSNLDSLRSTATKRGRIAAMSSMPLPPLIDIGADDRREGGTGRRDLSMSQPGSTPLKLLIRRVPGAGMRSLKTLPDASPLSKVVAPDVKAGKQPLV